MYPKPIMDLSGWAVRSIGCNPKGWMIAVSWWNFEMLFRWLISYIMYFEFQADDSVIGMAGSPCYGELVSWIILKRQWIVTNKNIYREWERTRNLQLPPWKLPSLTAFTFMKLVWASLTRYLLHETKPKKTRKLWKSLESWTNLTWTNNFQLMIMLLRPPIELLSFIVQKFSIKSTIDWQFCSHY